LYDGLSARRIRIASPTARAIVLLRDPRERAYAHYRNNVRDGIERRSFEDALREEPPTSEDWFHGYASISRYELQLPAAIKAFGDDLKILVYEEFFGAAAMSLADTFEWLDLDPSPAYTTEFKVYNPSSIPRVAITRGILGSRRLRGITRTFTTRPLRSAAYRAMMRATPASEMSVEAKTILSEILAPTYDTIGSVLGREIPAWGRHEVGP
jgi:hypothetical protein